MGAAKVVHSTDYYDDGLKGEVSGTCSTNGTDTKCTKHFSRKSCEFNHYVCHTHFCYISGLKLIKIFQTVPPTSQKINFLSITKANRLMLLRQIMAVYPINHTKHINSPYGRT